MSNKIKISLDKSKSKEIKKDTSKHTLQKENQNLDAYRMFGTPFNSVQYLQKAYARKGVGELAQLGLLQRKNQHAADAMAYIHRALGIQGVSEFIESGALQRIKDNKSSTAHEFNQLYIKRINRFIARTAEKHFNNETVQSKLTVSHPGDKYEKEADKVADHVMGMSVPDQDEKKSVRPTFMRLMRRDMFSEDKKGEEVRTKIYPEISLLQRQEEEKEVQEKSVIQQMVFPKEERQEIKTKSIPEMMPLRRQEEEKEEVQEKAISDITSLQKQDEENKDAIQTKGDSGKGVSPETESKIKDIHGRGKPLQDSEREYFEPRFGMDFSNVRIHTGSDSANMAKSVQARAFTLGSDIVFGQGEYNTSTEGGKKLLAHELTHTVQQGAVHKKEIQREEDGEPSFLKRKINEFAENIPGYTLLVAILGKNPITGQRVNQNARAFIRGFIGLIPGGEAIYQRLETSGQIEPAAQWLTAEVNKLNISFNLIKNLIAQAWDQMSIFKGLEGNLAVLRRIFGPVIQRIINFGKAVLSKLAEFAFRGLLRLVGAPVETIMGILNRGREVLAKIISNPMTFIKNFFNAVKKGFMDFIKNFITHFKNALFSWLFGVMEGTDIKMPETFDAKGIFYLVAQILGVTYEQIKKKIIDKLGPGAAAVIDKVEQAVELVKDIKERGPIVIWEKIQEYLTDLKSKVMDSIISWVRNTIIVRAITRIIAMLNPVGAIATLIETVYKAIMFFIENKDKIMALVNTIFGTIRDVAFGNIGGAARMVENALSRGLSLLITFLAKWIGLGGISKKIQEVIDRIRKPIYTALDKVIDFIVKKAKGIIDKLKKLGKKIKDKVKGVVGRIKAWWQIRKQFRARNGEQHTLYFRGGGRNVNLYMASNHGKKVEEVIRESNSNNQVKQEATRKLQEIKNVMNSSENNDREKQRKNEEINNKLTSLTSSMSIITLEETEDQRIKEYPVQFNSPKENWNTIEVQEYRNQLQNQENALNSMKAEKWVSNRDRFLREGRSNASSKYQREFRDKIRSAMIRDYIVNKNIDDEVAKSLTDEFLRDKVALHDPDQVAGGDAMAIEKLGLKSINSSIGSQWKDRVVGLDKHVREELKKKSETVKKLILMNVKLRIG